LNFAVYTGWIGNGDHAVLVVADNPFEARNKALEYLLATERSQDIKDSYLLHFEGWRVESWEEPWEVELS